jgi:hypothetical protein
MKPNMVQNISKNACAKCRYSTPKCSFSLPLTVHVTDSQEEKTYFTTSEEDGKGGKVVLVFRYHAIKVYQAAVVEHHTSLTIEISCQ